MSKKVRKTEHSGAKMGEGYWGTKSEAKRNSRKKRRRNSQREVEEQMPLKVSGETRQFRVSKEKVG